MLKSSSDKVIFDEKIIKTCCFVTKPQKGYRIIWEITSRCNYRCEFCFLGVRYKDLPIDIIKKIVDKLSSSLDINEILLGGREPLIREDIEEIIQYITEKNIKISISTNGSFSERLQKILRFKNYIRSVNLSIYSHKPEVNNRIHNVEDFDTLVEFEKSIRYLLDADVDTKVNIPLFDTNLLDLLKTIEYIAKLGVKKVSLLPITPIGDAKRLDTTKFNALMDFSNTNLYFELLNLSEKYGITITPLRIKMFESQKWLEKCFAGIKFLSVLPNGEITSCNLINNSNNCEYYNFSMPVLDNNFTGFINKVKNFFTVENSSIEQLLCRSIPQNISCGGGCRAVIASQRGCNIRSEPFEKFYKL